MSAAIEREAGNFEEVKSLRANVKLMQRERADGFCLECAGDCHGCRKLWPQQMKCCPDCTHGAALAPAQPPKQEEPRECPGCGWMRGDFSEPCLMCLRAEAPGAQPSAVEAKCNCLVSELWDCPLHKPSLGRPKPAPDVAKEPKDLLAEAHAGWEESQRMTDEWQKQAEAAQSELRQIDLALGNRSAFDDKKTREEKVLHAIKTAGLSDRLTAENSELKRKLEEAQLAVVEIRLHLAKSAELMNIAQEQNNRFRERAEAAEARIAKALECAKDWNREQRPGEGFHVVRRILEGK